jgi:hypothetical protein
MLGGGSYVISAEQALVCKCCRKMPGQSTILGQFALTNGGALWPEPAPSRMSLSAVGPVVAFPRLKNNGHKQARQQLNTIGAACAFPACQ